MNIADFHIIVLGGSMTAGRGVGGFEKAWTFRTISCQGKSRFLFKALLKFNLYFCTVLMLFGMKSLTFVLEKQYFSNFLIFDSYIAEKLSFFSQNLRFLTIY
jgi:hypothetical protein